MTSPPQRGRRITFTWPERARIVRRGTRPFRITNDVLNSSLMTAAL